MKTPYGNIEELPDTKELRAVMDPKTIMDFIRREWLFFKITGFCTGYTGPGRVAHLVSLCNILWQQPGKEVFKWNPWLETQLEAFCTDNTEVLLTGPNSGGKCLAPETPILMHDGSVKKAWQVCNGDVVMGDDSTARTVSGVTWGRSNMVRIIPEMGEPWECNDDHILTLTKTVYGKYPARLDGTIDISVKEYLKKTKNFKIRHRLFCKGVEFPSSEVPFDPQAYGIWLGDGTTTLPNITCADSETQVIGFLKEYFSGIGYRMNKLACRDRTPVYSFRPVTHTGNTANPFLNFIRTSCFGDGGSKRILKSYLFNSREVRLKLLAGIIDADGHASRTHFEIACSLDQLSEDIVYLARSLGFRTTITRRTVRLNGREFPSNRINVCGKVEDIPTLRKKCSIKKNRRNPESVGFKVEQLGDGDWCGFTIGGNGRFLLGDFTVTHNTFGTALYLLNQFYCSPYDTRVSVASTTRDGLKGRIWADFRKLHLAACETIGGVGHLIDSDICIQSARGDTRHGIFGVAIVQGEEKKALGRLIGFHTPRSFVAVDELTDVSWSVITSLTSFFTAKRRKQFIGTGNASFYFDSHGRMCEPEDGFNSITVNSDQWRTKRGGLCVHFNALKSPNVLAHRTVYDFLPTQADIDDTIKKYGESSPEMYRFRLGFWCPEGVTRTVLNNAIIARFQAMERASWKDGRRQLWAGLDPAFEGGDRCVLRFGYTGLNDAGVETLELARNAEDEYDIVFIKTDVGMRDADGKPVPIHYQIARQVKTECEARGIPPERFGMDTTGEGGGLASIISEEWGHGFVQVEFGGKASDLPVSEINSKPRNKEYYDRVTELWYSFRTVLMLGQIRGLDADTALEFCSRLFTVEGVIWLESKREMKARAGARSPDLADAAVILLNTVQRRGALGMALSMTAQRKAEEWGKLAEETEDSDPLFDGEAFLAVV